MTVGTQALNGNLVAMDAGNGGKSQTADMLEMLISEGGDKFVSLYNSFFPDSKITRADIALESGKLSRKAEGLISKVVRYAKDNPVEVALEIIAIAGVAYISSELMSAGGVSAVMRKMSSMSMRAANFVEHAIFSDDETNEEFDFTTEEIRSLQQIQKGLNLLSGESQMYAIRAALSASENDLDRLKKLRRLRGAML